MKLGIEMVIKVEKKEEVENIMFTDSSRKRCLAPFMETINRDLEEDHTVTIEHKYGNLKLTVAKEEDFIEYWGPVKLQQAFDALQEEVEDAIEDTMKHLRFHTVQEIKLKSKMVL